MVILAAGALAVATAAVEQVAVQGLMREAVERVAAASWEEAVRAVVLQAKGTVGAPEAAAVMAQAVMVEAEVAAARVAPAMMARVG